MTREELREKRRAEFEKWYKENRCAGSEIVASNQLSKCEVSSGYLYHNAAEAFRVWNAALDSVEIELPPISQIDDAWDTCQLGFNQGVEECAELIQQQGFKVRT